ncbi:ATP synthase subunit d, mitochondrial [Halotydeus destructor]|nr:ATP synthase subunit d, mitochondrial [Halotydeus destructor]
MAAKRITKSAIEWSKFARLVPECDRANYTAFKARSDHYLMNVLSNPENPPTINFQEYKKTITNKAIVDQLEQQYKALQVPYPKDTHSTAVDDEEKRTAVVVQQFAEISNEKIKEADALMQKFKSMIPYAEMTEEDFQLTFPDWTVNREVPSLYPNPEKSPGLTPEEAKEYAKSDPAPYSIP